MPVTGHKAYTGKEEEEDNLIITVNANSEYIYHFV
jgi:hypothetical protein